MIPSAHEPRPDAPLASASDPSEPYTYFHLRQMVRRERRRECSEDGRSPKSVTSAVRNTVGALDAFMRANGRSAADPVGPELFAPHAFDAALRDMDDLGVSASTVYRHRSELRRKIRPWAMQAQQDRLGRYDSLPELLKALMELQDLSCSDLARRAGMSQATLYSWLERDTEPSTEIALRAIGRLEEVLALRPGGLARFCTVSRVKMRPRDLKIGLTLPELRRVRAYLPADFAYRAAEEQEEIYHWVMTHIILSPRDTEETDEPEDRSVYRCRLRRHTQDPAEATGDSLADDITVAEEFAPPPHLAAEIEALMAFKASVFTPMGMERETAWTSPESVGAQILRLEIFFGAMLKTGVPRDELGLINILDPHRLQAFIEFMRKRRGRYTQSIVTVLHHIDGHLNPVTGFITQSRELLTRGRTGVPEDWDAACAAARAFLRKRLRELKDVVELGRDPFAPIWAVLTTPDARTAYAAVFDEIRKDIASAGARTSARSIARMRRDLMLARYPIQMPVRAANFARTLLRPKDESPSTMQRLGRGRYAELWYDRARGAWRHRQPKKSFKNWKSPATEDIDEILEDVDGFYDELEAYIAARQVLLGGTRDPGTLFVSDMRSSSKTGALTPAAFSQAYRAMVRRYAIYNPYTGKGAIPGLYVHGPQAVRHMTATDVYKMTGSFGLAGAAIFDTEMIARKNYARIFPQQQREIIKKLQGGDPVTARFQVKR